MTQYGSKRSDPASAEPREDGKIQGTMLDGRRADAVAKERANKNARRIGEVDHATVVSHYQRYETLAFYTADEIEHVEPILRALERRYATDPREQDAIRRAIARYDIARIIRFRRALAREERRRQGLPRRWKSRSKKKVA